jgi:hypothetical protein
MNNDDETMFRSSVAFGMIVCSTSFAVFFVYKFFIFFFHSGVFIFSYFFPPKFCVCVLSLRDEIL